MDGVLVRCQRRLEAGRDREVRGSSPPSSAIPFIRDCIMDPHDFLLSRDQLQEILKDSFDEDGKCESIFDETVVELYFTPVSMVKDIIRQPVYDQYLFKKHPDSTHVQGVLCYFTPAGSSNAHYYIVDCIKICGTVQYILYCLQFDDSGDVSLVDGLGGIKVFVKNSDNSSGKWALSFPVQDGVVGDALYSGDNVIIMSYLGVCSIGELYEGYKNGRFCQLTVCRQSMTYTVDIDSLNAMGITDVRNMNNLDLLMLMSNIEVS